MCDTVPIRTIVIQICMSDSNLKNRNQALPLISMLRRDTFAKNVQNYLFLSHPWPIMFGKIKVVTRNRELKSNNHDTAQWVIWQLFLNSTILTRLVNVVHKKKKPYFCKYCQKAIEWKDNVVQF